MKSLHLNMFKKIKYIAVFVLLGGVFGCRNPVIRIPEIVNIRQDQVGIFGLRINRKK